MLCFEKHDLSGNREDVRNILPKLLFCVLSRITLLMTLFFFLNHKIANDRSIMFFTCDRLLNPPSSALAFVLLSCFSLYRVVLSSLSERWWRWRWGQRGGGWPGYSVHIVCRRVSVHIPVLIKASAARDHWSNGRNLLGSRAGQPRALSTLSHLASNYDALMHNKTRRHCGHSWLAVRLSEGQSRERRGCDCSFNPVCPSKHHSLYFFRVGKKNLESNDIQMNQLRNNAIKKRSEGSFEVVEITGTCQRWFQFKQKEGK